MSTALQLQFFVVQAVNYSEITVKIKCKNPQYHKQKALAMVHGYFVVVISTGD